MLRNNIKKNKYAYLSSLQLLKWKSASSLWFAQKSVGKNSEQVSVQAWIACVTCEGRVARASPVTLARSRSLTWVVFLFVFLHREFWAKERLLAVYLSEKYMASSYWSDIFIFGISFSNLLLLQVSFNAGYLRWPDLSVLLIVWY